MGLLDSNRFLFKGNVSSAEETFQLTTAQSSLKTLSPKSGYKCIALHVVLDTPGSMLYVRESVSGVYEKKYLFDELGEIHSVINYFNCRRNVDESYTAKTFYLFSNELATLTLMNRYAVDGATAKVTVSYLKEIPAYVSFLKPRQVIYNVTKNLAAGATSVNDTIVNNAEVELPFLLRYFKYLQTEVVFYDSSNTKKNFSGTFKIFGRYYAPAEAHGSSVIIMDDAPLIEETFTNTPAFGSQMFETKGENIRYETALSTAAAEGDKMVIHIIGIR